MGLDQDRHRRLDQRGGDPVQRDSSSGQQGRTRTGEDDWGVAADRCQLRFEALDCARVGHRCRRRDRRGRCRNRSGGISRCGRRRFRAPQGLATRRSGRSGGGRRRCPRRLLRPGDLHLETFGVDPGNSPSSSDSIDHGSTFIGRPDEPGEHGSSSVDSDLHTGGVLQSMALDVFAQVALHMRNADDASEGHHADETDDPDQNGGGASWQNLFVGAGDGRTA